jgi:hypothetical protein
MNAVKSALGFRCEVKQETDRECTFLLRAPGRPNGSALNALIRKLDLASPEITDGKLRPQPKRHAGRGIVDFIDADIHLHSEDRKSKTARVLAFRIYRQYHVRWPKPMNR